MFIETKKIFVGTTHQDDWMLYHDALSLFTAKDSYNYMKERGYYEHLILPQNGLSSGTIYSDRMVGMRPDAMPLDAHLNQDFHVCVDRHVNLTQHLPCYLPDGKTPYPNKFSKRTPKVLSSAYRRIWDPSLGPMAGAPLGYRIIEDIERVVNKTYLAIFERRGRVLDTAQYTGRRAKEQEERYAEQWGGVRVKGTGPVREYWIHDQVKVYETSMIDACRRGFRTNNELTTVP